MPYHLRSYNSLKPVQLQPLLAEAGVSSGGLWLTATCWPWPDSTTIQATPAIITGGILILSQAVFSFHWEDLQTDFTAVTTQRDSAQGSHWGKWTVDHVKVPLSFCLLLSKKKKKTLLLNSLSLFELSNVINNLRYMSRIQAATNSHSHNVALRYFDGESKAHRHAGL